MGYSYKGAQQSRSIELEECILCLDPFLLAHRNFQILGNGHAVNSWISASCTRELGIKL